MAHPLTPEAEPEGVPHGARATPRLVGGLSRLFCSARRRLRRLSRVPEADGWRVLASVSLPEELSPASCLLSSRRSHGRGSFSAIPTAERRARASTRALCPLRLSQAALTGAGGSAVGVLCAFDDQARATSVDLQVLRDIALLAEERLRAAGDVVDDLSSSGGAVEGIVVHDGGVVLAATSGSRAIRLRAGGGDRTSVFDFAAPEHHPRIREAMTRDLVGPYEAEGIRKDGGRFPIVIRARPVTHAAVASVSRRSGTTRRSSDSAMRSRSLRNRTLHRDARGEARTALDTVSEAMALIGPAALRT